MAAHHVQHSVLCPAFGNGLIQQCRCGSSSASERGPRAKASIENAEANAERVREIMQQAWLNVQRAEGRTAEQITELLSVPGHQTLALCDRQVLDYLGEAVSSLSLRNVALSRPLDWDSSTDLRLIIHQRCPACREVHESMMSQGEQAETMALVAMVGVGARRDRLRHRCRPIRTENLDHLHHDELSAIAAELERDGTEMVMRSQEIAKIADERALKAPAPATVSSEPTEKGPIP